LSNRPLPLARRIRFHAEALGFDMLAGLVRLLGPDRASALSGALWRRIAPLNKRHARAGAQMRMAFPDLDEATIARQLDAMWDNLGRTMAESFHIAALVKDRARFEIDEDTRLAVEKARAGGAVFVSLHQGNWELAAPLLDSLGLPVAGIYQKLQNPFTERKAAAFRTPFYALCAISPALPCRFSDRWRPPRPFPHLLRACEAFRFLQAPSCAKAARPSG